VGTYVTSFLYVYAAQAIVGVPVSMTLIPILIRGTMNAIGLVFLSPAVWKIGRTKGIISDKLRHW